MHGVFVVAKGRNFENVRTRNYSTCYTILL